MMALLVLSLPFCVSSVSAPQVFKGRNHPVVSRDRIQGILETGGKVAVSTATGFLGFRLLMLGVKKTSEVAAAAIIAYDIWFIPDDASSQSSNYLQGIGRPDHRNTR